MIVSLLIAGLVSKRSELSGQIEYHQNQIKQIKSAITVMDRAIKVFDGDYDLRTIKSKRTNAKNSFFENREGSTLLMDIFREVQAPISTHDLLDKVIDKKSFNHESIQRKALRASVFSILKRLQGKGVVKELERDGSVIIWGLA